MALAARSLPLVTAVGVVHGPFFKSKKCISLTHLFCLQRIAFPFLVSEEFYFGSLTHRAIFFIVVYNVVFS